MNNICNISYIVGWWLVLAYLFLENRRFLRWLQIWCVITVRGSFLPQSLSWSLSTSEVWAKIFPVKTEAKSLSTSAFFSSIVMRLIDVFNGSCRSHYHNSLHPLPSSASAGLLLSWFHPYTSGQHPYISRGIQVPVSTVCAFPCCPLVWLGGLNLTIFILCLLFLISYMWRSRALPPYRKNP